MNNKLDQVPEEFKQLANDFSKNGFITTSLDNLINWSRLVLCTDDIWSCMLCG